MYKDQKNSINHKMHRMSIQMIFISWKQFLSLFLFFSLSLFLLAICIFFVFAIDAAQNHRPTIKACAFDYCAFSHRKLFHKERQTSYITGSAKIVLSEEVRLRCDYLVREVLANHKETWLVRDTANLIGYLASMRDEIIADPNRLLPTA